MNRSEVPRAALRLAYLGDMESAHTQRWLRAFRDLGHEVHAVSFYPPTRPGRLPDGVTLHVLREQAAPSAHGNASGGFLRRAFLGSPHSVQRLAHAVRFLRSGLRRTLAEIQPNILHAHFAVEHGLYAAATGFQPLVVSCWGSDLYVEARRFPGRQMAAWTLRRAAAVTANDTDLARLAVSLGAAPHKVQIVRLGVDDAFLLEGKEEALEGGPHVPTIISTRALEPLYNVGVVVDAFAGLRQSFPEARLVIAHDGSARPDIERQAARLGLGSAVSFTGTLDGDALRQALRRADVYVSVPSSDSMAVSTLEAMAAGCFPVLSDLPSQRDFITPDENGHLVPPGNAQALTAALVAALLDPEKRKRAAQTNRARVAAEAGHRHNMAKMEGVYRELLRRK